MGKTVKRSMFKYREHFARSLRAALERSGLKQRELAEKMSLSEPRISRYLSGQDFPGEKTVVKLASVLGLGADELYNLKMDEPKVIAPQASEASRKRRMRSSHLPDVLALISRVANLSEQGVDLVELICTREEEGLSLDDAWKALTAKGRGSRQ